MQDVEKNVPIDTSGNEVDVDIEETKDEAVVEQKEETVENPNVREVVKEETKEEPKEEVKSEEPKAEEEKPKDELGEYSDGFKKRIAKLTKKWREAERQKEAAITYAQRVEANRKAVEAKLGKLEPGFLDATEKSITALKGNIQKMADLNNQLQVKLQKAESYKDELRGKLSR